MTDAATYVAWIEHTLAERREGLGDDAQLAVVESLRDALAAGRSTMFGATIPSEHLEAVRRNVLPMLLEEIARLRDSGVKPREAERRPRLWPEHTRERIRDLERRLPTLPGARDALGPFRRVATRAVGSLRSSGFTSDSRHVLVVSTSGRGVFDARTGERVGRDAGHHVPSTGGAMGIAPIVGEVVPVMGIDGGVPLSRCTPDGWQLGVVRPEWEGAVWICPAGMDVDTPTEGASVLLGGFEELRALGFSPDGAHLLVAEQHTLHLFVRAG